MARRRLYCIVGKGMKTNEKMGKTYLEMAVAAIANLGSRSGSSGQVMKASIKANSKSLDFKQHLLRAALKSGVEKKVLSQTKASYKVVKVAKKAAPKKTAEKPAKKKATPKKKAVPKKK